MTLADRLTHNQIDVLLSLITRGASHRPVSLLRSQREAAVPLWRRRIVEIWYRQSPEVGPSFLGPFACLTDSGTQLALAIHERRKTFYSAPREVPGAGDDL